MLGLIDFKMMVVVAFIVVGLISNYFIVCLIAGIGFAGLIAITDNRY